MSGWDLLAVRVQRKTMHEQNLLESLRKRVYETATFEQQQILNKDDCYHAPYVFWGDALLFTLITKNEYDKVRSEIGSMWNYAGD